MKWWLIAKDPKNKLPRQPIHYPIMKDRLDEIPPASVLLFYNGQPLTEKEGRVKGFPYRLPPFHASFYLGNGEHLNQGKRAKIRHIAYDFRSTRRIDVITYGFLTLDDREMLCREARRREGMIYDIGGLLNFGFPFIREWRFANFCSEQVADIFKVKGFSVSTKEPEESEPFRLWEYAHIFANAGQVQMRTLHVGQEFPQD